MMVLLLAPCWVVEDTPGAGGVITTSRNVWCETILRVVWGLFVVVKVPAGGVSVVVVVMMMATVIMMGRWPHGRVGIPLCILRRRRVV